MEKAAEKNLLFFGAGKCAIWQCDACPGLEKYVVGIIDNDPGKVGGNVIIRNVAIPVISLNEAVKKYGSNVVINVTMKKCDSVIRQLKFIEEYRNVECYVYYATYIFNEEKFVHGIKGAGTPIIGKEPKIPKIIHYCWIGGSKIPESNQKCIDSWKRICPDYEIREWNENNYDFSKNLYMKQAYENKKWGFVPDFARLDIIYQYGGIYLDTDVEIVRSFDDLLYNDAFIGWENRYYVNAGSGFGASKHNPIIADMRKDYEKLEFVKSDGSLNLIASPKFQTDQLIKHGLIQNGKYQEVDGMHVYPANYFSPKSYYTGINWRNSCTYSIHHYDATWVKGETHDRSIMLHESYNQMLSGMAVNPPEDKMDDLISIIVPVYNVQEYLCKCLDSILNQTYTNIELILVDDGSTDESAVICDEYAEKYPGIKVIHKSNEGLAMARKDGVKAACGTYIMSVDSDDWIEKDMVAYMHSNMLDCDADFIVTNMILEFEKTGESRPMICSLKPGLYDLKEENNEVYKQFFVDDAGVGILHGICGKMFKKALYEKNQMNVDSRISRGEDAACVYPCYRQAQKVLISEKAFYHYVQREASILHNKSRSMLANWGILYNCLLDTCKFDDLELSAHVLANLKKFIFRRINIELNDEFPEFYTQNTNVVSTVAKVFTFPYKRVEKNCRIILYGAGAVGQSYYQQVTNSSYCYIVSWIDGGKAGQSVCGRTIDNIECVLTYEFDKIVISVKDKNQADEMKRNLINRGVPHEKIIWEKPQRYFVE